MLNTVAILAVLIGIKTLPLSYLITGMSMAQLVFTAIGNLENARARDSTTFVGIILALITVGCAVSWIIILKEPEPMTTNLKDINWDDPLIQIIKTSASESLAETSDFMLGLCATVIAGFCFSMSTSLRKSKMIPKDSIESQTFFVLIVCFTLATATLFLTRLRTD